MVALSPTKVVFVIAFAVRTEFAMFVIVAESVNNWSAFMFALAIFVMVAESPVALSKFIFSVEKWSISALSTFSFVIVALSKVAWLPVNCVLAIFVIVAESPEDIVKLVEDKFVILAESIFAFATVNCVVAKFVTVAESPNAESKFMNSVLICLTSELSTFKVLIVAESAVIWLAVNCVFAKFVIVALSPNAESKLINSVDTCLISELSAFKLPIVAESIVAWLPVNWVFAMFVNVALSPDDANILVIDRLPIVAESNVALTPATKFVLVTFTDVVLFAVIVLAVCVVDAKLLIVPESPTTWPPRTKPVEYNVSLPTDHLSFVSSQTNVLFADEPRLISIPPSCDGEPVWLELINIKLSARLIVSVLTVVVVPDTVKSPEIVTFLWNVSLTSVRATSESSKVNVEVALSYDRILSLSLCLINFGLVSTTPPLLSFTTKFPFSSLILREPILIVPPLKNKSFHFLVAEPKSWAESNLGIKLPETESFVKLSWNVSGELLLS